ncbi:MAG: hypothetical protein ACK56J_12460 [Planctomycetota bacterium]|jgi:hypothetical protein
MQQVSDMRFTARSVTIIKAATAAVEPAMIGPQNLSAESAAVGAETGRNGVRAARLAMRLVIRS